MAKKKCVIRKVKFGYRVKCGKQVYNTTSKRDAKGFKKSMDTRGIVGRSTLHDPARGIYNYELMYNRKVSEAEYMKKMRR